MAYLYLTIVSTAIFAQTIDYNTQNGYVADGYDLVAYFNDMAIEGNEEFKLEYQGNSYKFSSQTNLAIFKEDPSKYLPQYGGYCAWAIADKGKKVSINPESYEIRDGKLYLFYHKAFTNTLKKWQDNDPEKLKSKADINWENLRNRDN